MVRQRSKTRLKAHGAALGADEVAATSKMIGPLNRPFTYRGAVSVMQARRTWQKRAPCLGCGLYLRELMSLLASTRAISHHTCGI